MDRATGIQYAPISDTAYWVYRVDSIGFKGDLGSEPDTVQFALKFQSTGRFDELDSSSRIVEVYRRDSSENWRLLRSELWRINQDGFHKTADNSTIVHLVFPVELFRAWDGNLYNSQREDVFEIVSVHQPNSTYSIFTDSTLTVEQQRRENEVDSLITEELYGKDVGLLQRTDINMRKTGGSFRGKKVRYQLDEVAL